ncbi:Mrp/NBP35 family ATP-binding protein [Kosmotoga pacifica]|uniref:Iron-sulfur cluster carrier protein n=1 Tax=Kosmotoga pacifica TaxID=1330330 RepID=A0A0G2ZAK6_9BACT|nr:Mrp/NBP35 family ATP-binding protein [Kosmotoga pacifica]AKI97126.1 ATP-binding protein [Kosmotoga pacifica]
MATNQNNLAETMKKIRSNMSDIKHKILVMSGKGGVGKSTVATNLATALADEGYKTGILDIDLHGPNIVKMLGLKKKPVMVEEQIIPPEVFPNLKVISMASFLEEDRPVIWRGPLKTSAIYQFLGDVAWGELDFLIIDAPPGTGDESLTIMQTLPDVRPLMVTTPQEVAALDVKRALTFAKSLNKKTLGIVENMSYLKCPKCGEEIKLFGEGAGERLSRESSVPLLAKIPFDPQVVSNADSGKTIITHMRNSELEQAYRALVKNIINVLEG